MNKTNARRIKILLSTWYVNDEESDETSSEQMAMRHARRTQKFTTISEPYKYQEPCGPSRSDMSNPMDSGTLAGFAYPRYTASMSIVSRSIRISRSMR